MNQRRVVVAALVVLWSTAATRADPAVASAATSSLTQAHPGLQAFVDGERLIGFSGAVIAENTAAVATADFVGTFIQQNAAAFGVPELEFAIERTVSVGEGQDIIYTYRQVIEGLPVYGTILKIPVFMGPPESIAHLAKVTGIRFSDDQMRRLLHQQGFSFHRPQHTLKGKRDERAYEKARKQLIRLKKKP